jgi:tetratricopeptide (TPR) repeat protein
MCALFLIAAIFLVPRIIWFIEWRIIFPLSRALVKLAEYLKENNKSFWAEKVCRVAIKLMGHVQAAWQEAGIPWGISPKSHAMLILSICLLNQGKFKERLAVDEELMDELTKSGDHRNAGAAAARIASGLLKIGQIKQAEEFADRGLDILRPAFNQANQMSDPENYTYKQKELYRSELVSALFTRAWIHETLRQYKEAEPFRREALALAEARPTDSVKLPPHANQTTPQLSMLGSLLTKLGKYDEAEVLLKRCLDIRQRTLPSGHKLLASVHHSLGKLYCLEGKLDQAAPLIESAAASARMTYSQDPGPSLSEYLIDLGLLRLKQKDYRQAEGLLKETIAEKKRYYPETHPELLDALEYYLELLKETNREGEAGKVQEDIKAIHDTYGISEFIAT